MTVKVNSANLRSGPGRGYSSVGSATRGESFAAVAKATTQDGTWYLIDRGSNIRAWISEQVVDVANAVAIPMAATIPPPPVAASQPEAEPSEVSFWMGYFQHDLSEAHPFAFRFEYRSSKPGGITVKVSAYLVGLILAGYEEVSCNPERTADGTYYCSAFVRMKCNSWSRISEVRYDVVSASSGKILARGTDHMRIHEPWICK